MRTLLYLVVALAIVGLAFWAYRENYATQLALAEKDQTHADIRAAYGRLAVLRAEWAYLNRPDRLRELADLNFDKLQLFPLQAEQFGNLDQVALRPVETAPALLFENSVAVSSDSAGEGQ